MKAKRLVGLCAAVLVMGALNASAGTVLGQAATAGDKELAMQIERALERMPYYGVFDFLAFHVNKGVVSVMGYGYRPTLKTEAERAIKSVAGVKEVANKIEVLPTAQEDDRIRWEAFYRIYTDDFLSRYVRGGPMAVRYALLEMRRFPGMQPFGTYPIHIIVKNRKISLVGIVDNESDRRLANQRAAEVTGSAGVENELLIAKKG